MKLEAPSAPADVLRMAWRTARVEPARVFLPAVVIFGLDAACNTFFTEVSVDHLGDISVAAALAVVTSALGLTFYSGLLEQLVGAVERGEEAPALGRVWRAVPFGRLLMADAVVWLAVGVASLAFVLPGLVVATVFALVGPLIRREDAGFLDAFRRSVELVRAHWVLVLGLVTVPLAVTNELVDDVALLVPHEHIWLVFLTYLVLGMTFGVALGLVEVSLAERLVNGAPGPGLDPPAPLPSSVPTSPRRSQWTRRFTGR